MIRRRELIRAFERLEDGTLGLLVGTLVLVAIAQIVMRNVFSVSLLWAEPLIRHLVLWSGFVGAILATREGKHIKIEFLSSFLGQRARRLVSMLTNCASVIICFTLFVTAVRFVADEKQYGLKGVFDIPLWLLQLIFPVTFGVLALRFFVHLITHLRAIPQEGTD